MLEKAELVIKVKKHWIVILERCIIEIGGKVPPVNEGEIEIWKSPAKKRKVSGEELEEVKNNFDESDNQAYVNDDI